MATKRKAGGKPAFSKNGGQREQISNPHYSTTGLESQAPTSASHFDQLIDQARRFGTAAARRGDIERVALHFQVWHSLECARYGLPYAPMFGGAR